jgi:prohibitin 2
MVSKKGQIGMITFGIIAGILLIAIFGSIVTIDTGSLGIVKEFGKVTGAILQPGLAFKNPITQRVVEMSTRVKLVTKTSSSTSKDMQSVGVESAISYQIDSSKILDIYSEYGTNYEAIIIPPIIDTIVKDNMGKLSVAEMLNNREQLRIGIYDDLVAKLRPYNIIVVEYSVVDIQLSAEYDKAIEQKQVAEQNALKAEQELKMIQIQSQQQVAVAKANAEATRVNAQADADAILLKAQAQAQANTLLIESLSDEVLRKQWIEKWNGILPTYMLGEDANLLMSVE